MKQLKEAFDLALEKVVSRKLLVFIIATILTVISKVDSSDWTYIAIAYISMQGLIDVADFVKGYFKK